MKNLTPEHKIRQQFKHHIFIILITTIIILKLFGNFVKIPKLCDVVNFRVYETMPYGTRGHETTAKPTNIVPKHHKTQPCSIVIRSMFD